MKHIQTFESFLSESFSNADTDKAVELINKKIGEDPGYFFIGDEELKAQFNSFWKSKKYKQALNLLIGMNSFKDIKDYIETNESHS